MQSQSPPETALDGKEAEALPSPASSRISYRDLASISSLRTPPGPSSLCSLDPSFNLSIQISTLLSLVWPHSNMRARVDERLFFLIHPSSPRSRSLPRCLVFSDRCANSERESSALLVSGTRCR